MSNDSDKFHTRDQLESRGFTLEGNSFVSSAHDGDESPSPPVGEGFGVRGRQRYLPLYEAKMMHQFTHRWATYQPNGRTRDMTTDELRDPDLCAAAALLGRRARCRGAAGALGYLGLAVGISRITQCYQRNEAYHDSLI